MHLRPKLVLGVQIDGKDGSVAALDESSRLGPYIAVTRSEAALDEAALLDFVETAHIGLHRVDASGMIEWANAADYELLGYSALEYVGHDIRQFHANPEVIADILNRLSTGARVVNYEAQLRCKDGSLRDVSITSSVRFDEGRFVNTRCFTRDITSQKIMERELENKLRDLKAEVARRSQAEEELRNANEDHGNVQRRLRAVLDAAAIGTYSYNAQRDVVTVDSVAARLFGMDANETSSLLFARRIHADDRAAWLDPIRDHKREGARYEREYRIDLPDGSQRWLRDIATVIGIADEAALTMSGAVVDITEHKEMTRNVQLAADESARANQVKDDFLAMLGHELRNPLAPIVTALQLMTLRGEQALIHEREVIDRQVRHMSRLVDDLLDVSRVMRGAVELTTETMEISIAIARAVEMAEPLIAARAHELRMDVPSRGLNVRGDAARLSQVVANLLTNAARYTQPGGVIQLVARCETTDVVIEVADTGKGIDAELLPRIFDMFVQGARHSDRAEGGLGLGLTIVQSLVKQHGGTISATSAGSGKGSTFVVRLPLAEPVVASRDTPSPAAAEAEQIHGRRILVVDDNVDAAELLGELLKGMGNEVAVAYDGPQALIALESFSPDVMFLDIGLPGMDGYELARRIRAADGRRGARLIAMTGYGQADDRVRARDAGFDDHLVKPARLDAIVAAVRSQSSLQSHQN